MTPHYVIFYVDDMFVFSLRLIYVCLVPSHTHTFNNLVILCSNSFSLSLVKTQKNHEHTHIYINTKKLRYPILTGVRLRLLRKDEADAFIPASNNTTANVGLTEALLEEGGGGGGGNNDDAASVKSGGGGAVRRETTGTPNWWDGRE